MKNLGKINYDILNNEAELKSQTIIYNADKTKSISARRLHSFLSKIRTLSTGFEPMVGFLNNDRLDGVPVAGIMDGSIYVLYKQFEVEVYYSSSLLTELDFILPFIKYELIYQDVASPNITYQNTHKDLQVSDFYEVQDNGCRLMLKVGIYMRKVYGGATLQIPNVQLRISLRNSLKLSK